jgi:hypothetical protein
MTNRFDFRRYVALSCACALFLPFVASGVAYGKDKKTIDWGNVRHLRQGTAVTVLLKNNRRHVGVVKGEVTDENLPLTTKTESLSIGRETVKTIVTVARPKVANPGLYAMLGGVLLAAVGGLAGSVKDVTALNSGTLNSSSGKHGEAIEVAGMAIAAGGLAAFILVGKPRTIYEAPASASK